MGEQLGHLKVCRESHERGVDVLNVAPEDRSHEWRLLWEWVVLTASWKILSYVEKVNRTQKGDNSAKHK